MAIFWMMFGWCLADIWLMFRCNLGDIWICLRDVLGYVWVLLFLKGFHTFQTMSETSLISIFIQFVYADSQGDIDFYYLCAQTSIAQQQKAARVQAQQRSNVLHGSLVWGKM